MLNIGLYPIFILSTTDNQPKYQTANLNTGLLGFF
jgi:hypothetical protein